MKMVEKENDIPTAAAVPTNAVAENVPTNVATDPTTPMPTKDVMNKKSTTGGDLMGLARLFLKEYYTKLSDCPSEAGIFYGEDSHFMHDQVEETGRENIQRAIAKMNFEDCKARFYSVKAVSLSLQGDDAKMLQVCGELTLLKSQQPTADNESGPILPRRFVQTVVLAHQTPTVLYVKSDIFQWLDTAFAITVGDKYSPANNAGNPVPSPPTVEQAQPLENGGQVSPMVNGGGDHQHQQQTAVEPKKPTGPSKMEEAMNLSPPAEEPKKVEETDETQVKSTPQLPSVEEAEKPNTPAGPPPMPPKNDETTATLSADTPVEVPREKAAPAPPETAPPPTHVSAPKARTNGGSYAAIAAATRSQQPVGNNQAATQQQSHKAVHQPKVQESSTFTNSVAAATMPPPPAVMTEKPVLQVLPQEQRQPMQQCETVNNEDGTTKQQQQQSQQRVDNTDKQRPPPQQAPSSPPPVGNVAPRREWNNRIYFTQLNKPGRFVDFRQGQQELMREILAITDGVEFVGIKPNSLRREYRSAFGFIDLTTAADVQAVYDACKKDPSGAFLLKVSIPTFDFNGQLSLSAEKTSNLSAGWVGGRDGGGGGGGHYHQSQQQQQYRQSNQQGY